MVQVGDLLLKLKHVMNGRLFEHIVDDMGSRCDTWVHRKNLQRGIYLSITTGYVYVIYRKAYMSGLGAGDWVY